MPVADTPEWTPDEHLIHAARAGKVRVLTLPHHERVWIVALLTAEGMTGPEIAKMTGCGLRTVMLLRHDPSAPIAHYALAVAGQVDAAERRRDREARAARLAVEAANAEASRYRQQRDDLIDTQRKARA